MQRHELEAWLGDAWPREQIDTIAGRYTQAVRQYDITDTGEREALLVAISKQVDGTLDRGELIDADLRAQRVADEVRRAVRAAVRADLADGMSERAAAALYGVDRQTVRAWTGKQPMNR